MVKAIVKLSDHDARVLTIVKGKYGYKNRDQAISHIIARYVQDHLEPKLRPMPENATVSDLPRHDSIDKLLAQMEED